MEIAENYKPKKHGSKWTADDNRYLLELWYDKTSIADIAETLERTEFSVICQLPWKAEVKLSRILSELDNKEIEQKTISLYISDYPDLVDVEVDKSKIKKAQKEREKKRSERDAKISSLLKKVEFDHVTRDKSGLEELVIKVFSAIGVNSPSLLEIKERLVWIHALSLLFPALEYDILYTVYSRDGHRKKTYRSASLELDMPEHQVAVLCRNAVNRLILLLSVLGDKRENFTDWISMNKFTYANMTNNSPSLIFPEVTLKYDKIPTKLNLIDNYELSNTEITTLHKANIFCIGNLLEYEYEDLRFELRLDSAIARKVFAIKESYKMEGTNA